MIFFYIFLFLFSCLIMFFSGKWLVDGLVRIAHFLGWKEFVVAFLVVAFVTSFPNLFVGIISALHGLPQLSFGDVVGGNIFDLTIGLALAVLVSKGLPAQSRTVQTSSIFTLITVMLPLLLILDGKLGRGDGVILILSFFVYVFWLFSKKERFAKIYKSSAKGPVEKEFKAFISDLGKVFLGLVFLLGAAEGIVRSANFFAQSFHLPLSLIGILVVGFGNALPDTYFAVASAKKGQTWMILGDLMGSVVVSASLVLGIVALICPIEIKDLSSFSIAGFFLVVSALLFIFFVRSERSITKKEAFVLLFIYIIFVALEILTRII